MLLLSSLLLFEEVVEEHVAVEVSRVISEAESGGVGGKGSTPPPPPPPSAVGGVARVRGAGAASVMMGKREEKRGTVKFSFTWVFRGLSPPSTPLKVGGPLKIVPQLLTL